MTSRNSTSIQYNKFDDVSVVSSHHGGLNDKLEDISPKHSPPPPSKDATISFNNVKTSGRGPHKMSAPEVDAALMRLLQASKPVHTPHWTRIWHVGTYSLMLIDVVVFVYMMAHQQWQFASTDINPMLGPDMTTMEQFGARHRPLIVDDGQWYRLMSCIFLNTGVLSILIGCFVLWSIGCRVEEQVGSIRLVLVYIFGGLVGNVWSTVFEPTLVGVGSSGALFAIFGSQVSEFQHFWSNYPGPGRLKHIMCTMIFLVFGLAIGLMPFIDNFELIFGVLGGWSLGTAVFYGAQRSKVNDELIKNGSLSSFGMIVYVILLACGLVFMYDAKDMAAACPWCRWLTCVPTPWWDCDAFHPSDPAAEQDIDMPWSFDQLSDSSNGGWWGGK